MGSQLRARHGLRIEEMGEGTVWKGYMHGRHGSTRTLKSHPALIASPPIAAVLGDGGTFFSLTAHRRELGP